MKRAVAILLLALAPSLPRPTGACDLVPEDHGPHVLDPAHASDTEAPSAPVVSFEVYRAERESAGCGTYDTCGNGDSTIHVVVSATDDLTPADQLGYRFTILSGYVPPNLRVPADDRRPWAGDELSWRFAGDYRGAFQFDVEVRAVDLNGNVGPATVLTISDPGR
jgi:hypothetical protein